MPELPEVETVLQGIRPCVENQVVCKLHIRETRLRWPIPAEIHEMEGQQILKIYRRGKYLLFMTPQGTAILHLGMSGSLGLLQKEIPPQKHDHFDIVFKSFYLRYTDPRRFGAFLWTRKDPLTHPLLASLGIEPLDPRFNGQYLFARAKNRKIPIKQFIMNSVIVVGVGNIYATESLFLARINPLRATKDLNLEEFKLLASSIKQVLIAAIKQGGTTLKDFLDSGGKPGYFKQKLNVYGREGLPCRICNSLLKNIRIQNRSTVHCTNCQK